MKPNLFDFATKELSQDAFLLWLISWAHPLCTEDTELHVAAIRFIKFLVGKSGRKCPDIEKLNVYKQWEKIDVSFTVNDQLYVIIEDKTSSGTHGKQLEEYKRKATRWCGDNGYELICIYFKTGNESASSITENVSRYGYSVVTRLEILDILSSCATKNDIFTDYLAKLRKDDDETRSFSSLPAAQWTYKAWEGFYIFLEQHIEGCEWNYVSNPSGGFVGLHWMWEEMSDCSLYLQIEQGKLCVKIGEIDGDRTSVRERWHGIIMKKAMESGLTYIRRPCRFGNGNYMTIAVTAIDDYLGISVPDFGKTLSILHRHEDLVRSCRGL